MVILIVEGKKIDIIIYKYKKSQVLLMNQEKRGHIRNIIDRKILSELKQHEDDLHLLSDPINSAINSDAIEIAYYLIDVLHYPSQHGLRRALECNQIELACHLKDLNYELMGATNHIYNLETIKLVHQWGYPFDDNAVIEILHIWNGTDVCERLQYLYHECGYTTIPELDQLYDITDDVALLLYKLYDPSLYPQLMTKACISGWFQCIDYLIERDTILTPIDFEELTGCLCEQNRFQINRLRKLYTDVSKPDMIEMALKKTEELEEIYMFCRKYYTKYWTTLVDRLKFVSNLINWENKFEFDNPFLLALIDDKVLGINTIIDIIEYNHDIPKAYLFYRSRFLEQWPQLLERGILNFVKDSLDCENEEFIQAYNDDKCSHERCHVTKSARR